MSKSPWGGIGAWAADAERAEAEEREAAAAQPPPSFPSLKEAVNTTKQKKKTKMSLQEFTMQPSAHQGSAASRGLTPEEMMRLPTGPKERSPDEMQYGRLGGGFTNYGSRPGSLGCNQGRAREYEDRRSLGYEDDNRRGGAPQSRVSEFNQPSRADGVDNWASTKKQTPTEYNSGQARPGGKYSSLGGGGGPGVASRADEADNWASVKKLVSQQQQQKSINSGFRSGSSRPEPDRWTRNEPRLVLESPKNEVETGVKVNKPDPFGAARPREEVLAEKGLDWKKLDLEIEGKKQQQNSVSGGSRPTSSQSSRPETPHSSRSETAAVLGTGEGVVKQKPKVNPFGDAKPREVLLEEKGLDWKKIDLELERRQLQRPESEEEKNLKEEIEHLKKELLLQSSESQTSMHGTILQKEQELELLARQLDDKVRYSQKIIERQGSGAGRGAGLNERPPSRPGAYEEPRGVSHDGRSMPGAYEEPRAGYLERPHSQSGMYEDLRARVYEDPRAGFAERTPSRPGAYENPQPGPHNRPRSRSGAYDESRAGFPQRSSYTHGAYQDPRAVDYNERPRSRGTVNSWTRQSDDRRTFQGGGGRGFLGSRDVDRSGSRW